jgi:dynein light intermediate chain 1
MKYGLMNYSHLTVKKNGEEDLDTVNKIGVWIMNELIDEETFLALIKPKDILNSVCLIVADYSRPWTINDSIKKWADFIYTVFGKLILKYPFDKQNEIRKKSKKIYK